MCNKIDLVYLWCDGEDPQFKKRKAKLAGNEQPLHNDKKLYEQIDELKFSLRSAHMYAPWINHIFIVTDRQIPSWLNTDNPKISIIDHSQILPPEVIPNFNSCAIETALYKIPNLSECFLYSNDDMFFYNPVSPHFFFNKNNKPIIRLKKVKTSNNDYYKTITNAQQLVKLKTGKDFNHLSLHHNIDAYLKSCLEECNNTFSKELGDTQKSQFRDISNIQRVIFSYFHLTQNKGQLKLIKRTLWQKICALLNLGSMDSFVLNQSIDNVEKIKRLKRFNPKLFCLNDSDDVIDNQRQKNKEFLQTLFPHNSPFEK